MIWKGNTTRSKFFWPESRMPSRDEMQNAANGFYPGSRLMAYYPSEDEGDFMVLIPPLTENYEFVPFSEWVQLNDEDTETYQTIMEEVGEPVSTPELLVEGYYEVVVENHDTGEHQVVHFGEAAPFAAVPAVAAKAVGVLGKAAGSLGKAALSGAKGAAKGAATQVGAAAVQGAANKVSNKLNPPQEYVKEDDMKGMSQKSGDKRSTESGAGLTAKGVAKYRRQNPGSKLKTAVTTPPSKLKPGSKAANRRKSFCARSRGWNGERGKAARRRWNC